MRLQDTSICLTCGVAFHGWPNQPNRFCSHPCYIRHRYGQPRAYTCAACGIEFAGRNDSSNRFCSQACAKSDRQRRAVDEVALRFWAKVDKSGDCWLWTASTQQGYGQFLLRAGRPINAHRFAWELEHGPIGDSKLFVCHNCPGGDNPQCVRPSHMFLGANEENIRDAVRKGHAIGRPKVQRTV